MRLLSCFVCIFALASCAVSNSTNTVFRGGYDFTALHSYSIYSRHSAFGEMQSIADSTRNHIELAIEQNFASIGLTYQSADKADVVIAYLILNPNSGELARYNQQVKYCGFCLNAGTSAYTQLQKNLRAGSLLIDIVDVRSQRSIWRSVYPLKPSDKDNSRERQSKIRHAVDTMLKDFPLNASKKSARVSYFASDVLS
ncbi:protein of unknown function [Colwellia chukchiensis]|uniref:DUF4136 domain-containing protein n=1 Tax=Colwellia chukchiensis TaxID=641665 RepID=A0A1H7LKI7_9GAMM|nr:DUF4136 domain-containing protein [Colwellia chukchiensis]SEK99431.1 protein of unknown function [Colwellia chukchiensis]